MLRELVLFYDQDRYFAPDIEKSNSLITSGALNVLVNDGLLPSVTA